DIVGRRIIAIAAVAYVGILVAAVWTWGGATAAAGRATQLRNGALVRPAVDGVRLPLQGTVVIGPAADAAIRIPGGAGGTSGADGAATNEVARIEAAAGGGATVRGKLLAATHGGDAALVATLRGCAPGDASYGLPVGAAIAAIECEGERPVRGFVI